MQKNTKLASFSRDINNHQGILTFAELSLTIGFFKKQNSYIYERNKQRDEKLALLYIHIFRFRLRTVKSRLEVVKQRLSYLRDLIFFFLIKADPYTLYNHRSKN